MPCVHTPLGHFTPVSSNAFFSIPLTTHSLSGRLKPSHQEPAYSLPEFPLVLVHVFSWATYLEDQPLPAPCTGLGALLCASRTFSAALNQNGFPCPSSSSRRANFPRRVEHILLESSFSKHKMNVTDMVSGHIEAPGLQL